MMIEPPIDELTKKANGNKYVLSIVAAKRAKEIETTRRNELATADKKSISIALDEIAEGKIVPSQLED
ncbi:MAG: DNA-directed RNA polymerase subunit omega [Clostridia bacterium]|nr:DNA-directed RNA polymerase subunit omega [Clostridia bacterium]